MTAVEHLPAADYRCLVGRTGCVACRPDAWPCDEFKAWGEPDDKPWCVQCGWVEWAHEGGSDANNLAYPETLADDPG